MSQAPEIKPGVEIGRYRIVKRLGGGAAGTVYEAFDQRLERPVAMKIADVPDAEAAKDEFAQRFSREARIAASLSHPNLCPVYDFGTHAGRPFIVMALLPGATLADLVARHAPLAADRILVLLRPIAEALAEMHRSGLVHRDIKPQNILLDARLEPLLTDYGLARPEMFVGDGETPGPNRTGAIAASPAYLAPEQLRSGQRVGPPADMHAFGVVLYELMTGRLPFSNGRSITVLSPLAPPGSGQGEGVEKAPVIDRPLLSGTPDEMIEQIINVPPPRPSQIASGVARELEQLCLHLLRKQPSDRPSAAEAARRMRAIADRGTFNIIPPAGPERPATPAAASSASPSRSRAARRSSHSSRSREWPSIIGLLLALVVLVAIGYGIYGQQPWEWIASLRPDAAEVDSEPTAERGGRSPDTAPPVDPDRAPEGGATPDVAAESDKAPREVEQVDPELIAAPGRLFARGGEITVAVAQLPASPQGRAAVWWSGDAPEQFESLDAASLVPAREGGRIVGVLVSESGETVAVLGESWYARVVAAGGPPVTNRVSGWLTVERAATSPSGHFALLQKTGLENRKRISVWKVADDANPADLMAIYCDASTTTVTVSPDGRGLAFGDSSGRVSMQQIASGAEVLAELQVAGPVTGVAFSSDNLKLAVAHQAGAAGFAGITIFTYASGEWSETQRIATEEEAVPRAVSWSPDATRLCGVMQYEDQARARSEAPDRFASVWDLEVSGREWRIADVAGDAAAWTDDDTVIAGHADGRVRRWKIPAG